MKERLSETEVFIFSSAVSAESNTNSQQKIKYHVTKIYLQVFQGFYKGEKTIVFFFVQLLYNKYFHGEWKALLFAAININYSMLGKLKQ